ncbi:MAG: roadblock/LC7 domain-containing protein [Candidatus Hodarchaeota archaeon]
MSGTNSTPPDDDSSERNYKLKCPTCKKPAFVTIQKNIKDFGEGGLVNVLIPSTSTQCGHTFQIFVDAAYRIRGYTRIDIINESGVMKESDQASVVEKEEKTSEVQTKSLAEKDESKLSPKEQALKKKLEEIIRNFSTSVPETKAIACFDYEGYIIAKALTEELKMEDISMMAASMMSQSSIIGKSLRLKYLEDFSLTSTEFRVIVKKAGELLILIYYDNRIKPGLMNLNIKRLVKSIEEETTPYIS